ncbi:MAG: NADH-quinone oxidoreductase subunit M [Acidobacteria bacterium]|nr:NADH-quinone oxidoreductase subunit M [Acidobacteriota bacterium]
MDNLLSIILWLPLLGAVITALIPKHSEAIAKGTALFFSLATFLVSLLILPVFVTGEAGFQLVERYDWIRDWGVSYALGVDGISLWLILLTTLLTPVVVLSQWSSVTRHVKEYMVSMLVLEFGMLGAFLAVDLVFFYVFFELMLLPMYLIIGVWGGRNRIYAAIKFFLFTIAGSLLMLVGVIYLGVLHAQVTGAPSFAFADLYALSIPQEAQLLLFLVFSLAFAIKVPLFPLHTWLPDAHVEAPTGGSIILAGVLLKLGTYGFVRFVLPIFPDTTYAWAPLMAALSVIGIIYGALVAWVQPDMKKLVAYSSVSHLGFVVLGIFALTQASLEGAMIQMVNHGLSTGALFLLVGVIYERRHSRQLADFGGIAGVVPIITVLFVISVLASVGLPGLNGFIGEFLILAGSYPTFPLFTILATTGVILAAIYLLWLVQKVFFGPLVHEENRTLPDIRWNELVAVLPLVLFMVWIGVHPETFLEKTRPSVKALMATVEQNRTTQDVVYELGEVAPAADDQEHVSTPLADDESEVGGPTPSVASLENASEEEVIR